LNLVLRRKNPQFTSSQIGYLLDILGYIHEFQVHLAQLTDAISHSDLKN